MEVVPVIVPSLPWPERSSIRLEPVSVSMSYASRGSPTVRVNPEVRVIVPSVAWTLTTYVPGGVLDEVASVRFAVLVGLPAGGVNAHVAPAGRPVQEYSTLWLGPKVRWAVTVGLTDCPCTGMKPEDGLTEREKSNGEGVGAARSGGAQAVRVAPRPAPRVPPEAETVCQLARFQLSTTASAPKIRSMSRAQGTFFESGVIEKPQLLANSCSTLPAVENSVARP